MKMPIKEINEKYYESNTTSHIPKIIKIIKTMAFGLIGNPEKEIAKIFYDVMFKSKNPEIIKFMEEKLHIISAIKRLYLDK